MLLGRTGDELEAALRKNDIGAVGRSRDLATVETVAESLQCIRRDQYCRCLSTHLSNRLARDAVANLGAEATAFHCIGWGVD